MPKPSDAWINTAAGAIFAVLGGAVIWQSQKFESLGSVTPVFIGICLILLSLGLIATAHFAPQTVPAIVQPEGSLQRRAIGAVLLILWVALLPYLGFLATAILAFLAISRTVPRAEAWTARTFLSHAGVGTAIAVGFWFVLTGYLGIALPEAKLLTILGG